MSTKAYNMFQARGRPKEARDVPEDVIQKWRDIETQGKVLVCPRCLMSFTAHLGLLQHYRHCFDNVDIANNGVKYSCPKCFSEFANTKSLSHHKRYCPGEAKVTKNTQSKTSDKVIELSVVEDERTQVVNKTIYVVSDNSANDKTNERVRVEMIKRKRPIEVDTTIELECTEVEEDGVFDHDKEGGSELPKRGKNNSHSQAVMIQEETLEPISKIAR